MNEWWILFALLFRISAANDSSWGFHNLPVSASSNMENAHFSWYIHHFPFISIIPNILFIEYEKTERTEWWMIFVWRTDSLPYDALWDVFCAWISKMAGKMPKNEKICSLEFNNGISKMKTISFRWWLADRENLKPHCRDCVARMLIFPVRLLKS